MTKRQEMIFTVIQDLMLAFVINSAATILNGGFTDTWVYLAGMFEAFSINYVAGAALPVPRAGMAAANALGLKEGTFVHKLVRVFVINAIYVTIISFTIALPTITPSDFAAIFAACSGFEMPKPIAAGMSDTLFTSSTIAPTSVVISLRTPVTPSDDTQ